MQAVIQSRYVAIPGKSRTSVENGVLVLSGQRRLEKENENRKYHRIERSYGSFSLPDDADSDKVNAEFKEGVLKLHIPKSAFDEESTGT
jgi:HSP20 family protein